MKRLLLYLLALACCPAWVGAQSTVDTRIAVNSQTDDQTFVVIISNENYKHEEHVPFALNDGDVFRVYCEKTLGIPASHIHLAADATLNEMNFELDWLADVLKAYEGDARAIVYYTGHGMPDERSKDAYLLPVDGYSKSPASALSTKSLYGKLGQMQTNSVLVLLDACFSGAKRDGQMLASSRGVAVRARDEVVAPNTVVFSAAQGDETAYPLKSQQHGLFTYYVLEKMQAEGGAVTLGDLSDYVQKQVRRQSVVENGKSQTPTVVASAANQGWRSWRLARTAAKSYESRAPRAASGASQPAAPVTASPTRPAVVTTPATTVALPVSTAPAASTALPTPRTDSPATAQLVEQGRKAIRAMQYDKARRLLLQAANQGSTEACYQLGLLYSNSNYDDYSRETATNYFTMAAQTGHVEAIYQTGMMYVGTDNATARQWLKKAADRGHEGARKQLSRMR